MTPSQLDDVTRLAAVLGSRGGKARAANLSSKERSSIAKQAAYARWHPHQAQEQRLQTEAIEQAIQKAITETLGSHARR